MWKLKTCSTICRAYFLTFYNLQLLYSKLSHQKNTIEYCYLLNNFHHLIIDLLKNQKTKKKPPSQTKPHNSKKQTANKNSKQNKKQIPDSRKIKWDHLFHLSVGTPNISLTTQLRNTKLITVIQKAQTLYDIRLLQKSQIFQMRNNDHMHTHRLCLCNVAKLSMIVSLSMGILIIPQALQTR